MSHPWPPDVYRDEDWHDETVRPAPFEQDEPEWEVVDHADRHTYPELDYGNMPRTWATPDEIEEQWGERGDS